MTSLNILGVDGLETSNPVVCPNNPITIYVKQKEPYKLFICDQFYPNGGYQDFKGNFESPEKALEFIVEKSQKDQIFLYEGFGHLVQNDKIIMKYYFEHDYECGCYMLKECYFTGEDEVLKEMIKIER